MIGFINEQQEHLQRSSPAFRYSYYNYGTAERLDRTIQLDEDGIEQFFTAWEGEDFEGKLPDVTDPVWHISSEEQKPKLLITGDANGALCS